MIICTLQLSVLDAEPISLKVASDTQWLLHLDWEHFQSTQVGGFINETFLNPHREKIREELKRDWGFDFDWDKFQSITAFGNDYNAEQGSLLLVRSELDLQTSFHELLESKVDAGLGPLKIQPIKSKLDNLYAIAGELYVAIEPNGLFLLGRTRKQIEESKSMLDSSQTPINQVDAFADYPVLPERLIFLAIADGFDNFSKIPSQARVLKMSKGARIALCETDETLLVQMELKTKDAKTSAQIHAVLQGMITLAMLSGNDERLADLAESVRISNREEIVTMKLELPIERALNTLKRFAE